MLLLYVALFFLFSALNLKVEQEENIKAQIFSVLDGKPYEEHVVRRIHLIENNPKRRDKQDSQVRLTLSVRLMGN